MDTVDRICRDIHCTLESECQKRYPQINLDRLRQREDIKPFLPQKIRRLMRPVSSEDHKAVQIQLMIGVLHRLHLVQSLLIRNPHQFKWLPGGSEDRAAHRQNTGEVLRSQHLKIRVDQPLISIFKSIDLHIFDL